MSNYNKKPVTSIKYQKEYDGAPGYSRVSIPDSSHQGEEASAIDGMPEKSQYDIFRHEFKRGMDPELYWLDKYKNDDDETKMPQLDTDIRSLYAHEDVRPEAIIEKMYEIHEEESNEPNLFEDFFADEDAQEDELDRLAGYYKHEDNWRNRLILGDSLLVMNSLLNRERMKGQVQCVYIDPPYGIRFGSNWQNQIGNPKMSHESKDQEISGEPEMIKAYRDTWELGIHSYLSYLRDRLVLSRELLSETGSCFVQISDDNVHLVRNLMDEVFGSENFISQIFYKKTSGAGSPGELVAPPSVGDYILWFAKNREYFKYRKIFVPKEFGAEGSSAYRNLELKDGKRISIPEWEKATGKQFDYEKRPEGSRVYTLDNLTSQSGGDIGRFDITFEGKLYKMTGNNVWKTNEEGIKRLIANRRVDASSQGRLGYVRYFEDFPMQPLTSLWTDAVSSFMSDKIYVVQSNKKAVQRCLLMATDPGDLVLDPTCGSGTTAYVAEQWGRRWITMDTSRIALNVAKKRLVSAVYPFYETFDESENPNIHLGFKYKKIQHITLKSIANNLLPEEEVLYDQPLENKKRIRVTGPFTVEALQSLNVSSPETLSREGEGEEEYRQFVDRIFNNMTSNGIRNGRKEQHIIFHNTEHLDEPYLNARGWYKDANGQDVCVYFMIGPKFGTVSKLAVNEAVKAFRRHLEESSWLVILGFSFEDTIDSGERTDVNFGTFQVSKVRMSDDLLQDGLLKKDKTAGSFIIIGEPDVELIKDDDNHYHVEILGMDMYDPVKDQVKARNAEDIAYWEMDDDYTDSIFKVRSIHFSGGDRKEFAAWRKGLDTVARDMAKRRAERTLRMQFAEELWDRLYSLKSEFIEYRKGRKIAVRVVSQFGEEATRILEMN